MEIRDQTKFPDHIISSQEPVIEIPFKSINKNVPSFIEDEDGNIITALTLGTIYEVSINPSTNYESRDHRTPSNPSNNHESR